jgi:hypothetical protein
MISWAEPGVGRNDDIDERRPHSVAEREEQQLVDEPVADRPHMPGYGIADAAGGRELLPWNWAAARLERAHNYFVATARQDGTPHLMPVWGVWLDGVFYFSTGGRSRKARNLRVNPRCVISPEGAEQAVVLEGIAERVTEPAQLARLLAVYTGKYGSGFPDPAENPVFAVRPRIVFGFIEHEAEFAGSATRWTFG